MEEKVITTYSDVLCEVHKHNAIKYAAYRTGSKLCALQKGLKFETVTLNQVKGVFFQHRFSKADNSLILDDEEVEAIVHDVYYAGGLELVKIISVDLLTKVFVHFLRDAYGPRKTSSGLLSVFNLKIALSALCGSPLERKYQYWFSELSDHNLCLSRRYLKSLLEALVALASFLSESNTFSQSLIGPTLDSCFVKHSLLGITEVDFMCWVFKEPQLLVWLSTFYRLRTSEKISHGTRCAACRVSPIIGLRYRCLRCISYDLCQTCFFTARTSKKHKTSHMIREYCYPTASFNSFVTYLKGIVNRIWGQSSQLQYLPARDTEGSKKDESGSSQKFSGEAMTQSSDDSDELTKDKPDTPDIQGIISQIEKETRLLKAAVSQKSNSQKIAKHAHVLQEQLDLLRSFQDDQITFTRPCIVSTPMNPMNRLCNDFEMSSIVEEPAEWESRSHSGFSTWLKNSSSVDTTHTKKLQADLDEILNKLHAMLENNFSDCE